MRLGEEFFHRDCLVAAPELVGKVLVRSFGDGRQERLRILETEAYRGEEDTACHAHKGRTKRTEVLYREHGRIYVYLCYGIHWLLNFVTGDKELDAKFVKEAEAAGFVNLKGHRTVGGMRASIYNAMPKEGVEKLAAFMKKFEEEN